MTNVWFTSDPHFGHERILSFCSGRAALGLTNVKEMNEYIVEKWNSLIRPTDIVWCLGDFAFGRKYIYEITPKLNGSKRLIMGNHDQYGAHEFVNAGWDKVYGAFEKYHCIMTHIPISDQQFYRFHANIHGHMHDKKMDDPRYICVCMDQNDELRPYNIDEIKKLIELAPRREKR